MDAKKRCIFVSECISAFFRDAISSLPDSVISLMDEDQASSYANRVIEKNHMLPNTSLAAFGKWKKKLIQKLYDDASKGQDLIFSTDILKIFDYKQRSLFAYAFLRFFDTHKEVACIPGWAEDALTDIGRSFYEKEVNKRHRGSIWDVIGRMFEPKPYIAKDDGGGDPGGGTGAGSR
jgi:hypothetical protein